MSWVSMRQGHEGFLLLRYEDLLRDTMSELARVARFLKIEPTPERLSQAIEKSSAGEMRKLEKTAIHRLGADQEHAAGQALCSRRHLRRLEVSTGAKIGQNDRGRLGQRDAAARLRFERRCSRRSQCGSARCGRALSMMQGNIRLSALSAS